MTLFRLFVEKFDDNFKQVTGTVTGTELVCINEGSIWNEGRNFVDLKIIASDSSFFQDEGYVFNRSEFNNMLRLKKVSMVHKRDLLLFVDKPYKSDDFINMLKGSP